jgi:hypothetical protein
MEEGYMMRTFVLVFILGLAGCLNAPDPVGSVIDGQGFVKLLDEGRWKEAESNSVIYPNDFVRTGDGKRLHFRVDGNELVMDENTNLFVTDRTDKGYRRICLEEGDLFLSVGKGIPILLETAAGNILCRRGLLFLRVVARQGKAFVRSSLTGSSEMQMNVAVVGGEAVVENMGRARRVAEGFLCYSETGAPPTAPVETDPEALQDTREWLMRQFSAGSLDGQDFGTSRRNVLKPRSANGNEKKTVPADEAKEKK